MDAVDRWARALPGRTWRRLRGLSRGQWGVVALAVLVLFAVGADLATRPPPLPAFAAVKAGFRPSEAWLYDGNGVLLDSSRVNFAQRRLAWVPLGEVAPTVPDTIVAAEDRRFRDHGGVDWLALAGSVRDRLEGKAGPRGRRGASTLSMQVAAFLSPALATPGRRSVWDKLRQLRAARALEARWSKDEVLEAYLNLAGYRGEAQGIGAAALSLFGKTPATLTSDDALLLAALLPDPRARADQVAKRACNLLRSFRALRLPAKAGAQDRLPGFARQSRNVTGARRFSTALETNGCGDLVGAAVSALGPARSLALDPGLAPHLADRLLTKPGLRVATTLDVRVQRVAAAALRRQLLGLGATRARDGAVVVLDNASGDVLAYVGGVGGASTAPAVDGASAYRQAGSTLKPFLYAQALERGYLTPASILDDSPVQLDTASGLYVPQNYDRAFKGPVSARTALAGSLNVPAVRTLLLVGVEPFRDRLWDTGFRGLTEDGQYYGFSLALGSAEVTLLEQAAAYRSLARGGRWAPPRVLREAPAVPDVRTTSPQAAWLVVDMIADAGARAGTFGMASALRLPFRAAVKTGTSKAMRDNWCVGFTDRYTVAVWIGNVEGDPMRAVSGTSGAAPVWRDVMLALGPGASGSTAPAPPPGIEARIVRFAQGPARREFFLRGTGQAVVVAAPESARRPRIVNPASGSVYALDPDIPPDRQRLVASVTGPVAAHRLVLDRRDLGPADTAPQLLAGRGAHLLRLVDAGGRVVDQVRFIVR